MKTKNFRDQRKEKSSIIMESNWKSSETCFFHLDFTIFTSKMMLKQRTLHYKLKRKRNTCKETQHNDCFSINREKNQVGLLKEQVLFHPLDKKTNSFLFFIFSVARAWRPDWPWALKGFKLTFPAIPHGIYIYI